VSTGLRRPRAGFPAVNALPCLVMACTRCCTEGSGYRLDFNGLLLSRPFPRLLRRHHLRYWLRCAKPRARSRDGRSRPQRGIAAWADDRRLSVNKMWSLPAPPRSRDLFDVPRRRSSGSRRPALRCRRRAGAPAIGAVTGDPFMKAATTTQGGARPDVTILLAPPGATVRADHPDQRLQMLRAASFTG
jgi:hypothetical protein